MDKWKNLNNEILAKIANCKDSYLLFTDKHSENIKTSIEMPKYQSQDSSYHNRMVEGEERK